MKLKIFKLTIFLLLLCLSGCYFYLRHLKYLSKLKEDVELLQKCYQSFAINYYDAIPKDKEDFEKMVKWNVLVSGDIKFNYTKYGFNVKYDTINGIATVYTYGKDKVDNNLKNTPYNDINTSLLGQHNINDRGFLNYIRKIFIEKDIILLKIKPSVFPCDNWLNDNQTQYQLYNQEKSLLNNLKYKKDFFEAIQQFEVSYNKEHEMTKSKLLYFIFNKGGVRVICRNGISTLMAKNIETKLKDYFATINTDYFDYALFSLNIADGK